MSDEKTIKAADLQNLIVAMDAILGRSMLITEFVQLIDLIAGFQGGEADAEKEKLLG